MLDHTSAKAWTERTGEVGQVYRAYRRLMNEPDSPQWARERAGEALSWRWIIDLRAKTRRSYLFWYILRSANNVTRVCSCMIGHSRILHSRIFAALSSCETPHSPFVLDSVGIKSRNRISLRVLACQTERKLRKVDWSRKIQLITVNHSLRYRSRYRTCS